VFVDVRVQTLDGDRAAELWISGLVHRSHGAASEPFADDVASDLASRRPRRLGLVAAANESRQRDAARFTLVDMVLERMPQLRG
jgi:hypothetical protein